MASLSVKDLLRFVHLAGTERSTTKVFAELSHFIGETLQAHRVSVYIVEKGRFTPFVSEYSSGTTNQSQLAEWLHSTTFDESVAAARLRAGEEVVLASNPTDVLPRQSVETHGTKSLLVAGLCVESELLGAILIEGAYEDLKSRQTEIRELAGIVALAIENAVAFERERKRTEENEALLEVAAVLTESTDVGTVLAAVARNSASVTGFERCSIFLVEDDGNLNPVMSQFADGHADIELWNRFRSIRADLPAARKVIDSGMPAVYSTPETIPELIPPEWLTLFSIDSLLFVPLTVWGKSLGVLLLDHREHRPIAPQQIRIAQAVAAQGAAAIGISRLLQREGDSRREAEAAMEALRVRESQQAATAALSQSAVTATDVAALMDEAVQVLATTLDVEFAKVLEFQPEEQHFLLKAGVGWDKELVGTATIEAGPWSQAGYTMSETRPVVVEHLATEQRFSGPSILTEHGVVSGMSVVIDGRDRPYGVLGVHTRKTRMFTAEDISFLQSVANLLAGAIERRAGERAIIEGERRLQGILDSVSDAIISTDDQKIIVFNGQASHMFGYTAEEVLGKPIQMLIPDRFAWRDHDKIEAFTSGDDTQRVTGDRGELLGRRKNGEEFPVEITISKVEVNGQRVLTSVVHDITQRVEAQRRIRQSEQRFRNLFERSPIAMWEEDFSAVGAWLEGLRHEGVEDLRSYIAANPDTLDEAIDLIRVLNVNPAGVRLIGADSVEQLLGAFPEGARTKPVRESFLEQFAAIWEGTEGTQFEIVGNTFGGVRIDCVLHFAAMRTDDGLDLSHVIIALADITERKAAEEQLRRLGQSKDELIASVSHEIRTPLTAVLGFAQLLRDERANLSESEHAEMIEALLTQSTDIANIVEDLLVAAKADIGKLHVVDVPVDLRAQAAQVLETWDHEVVARVDLSGPPARCMADPARVRQIVRNLITNALRYGGPNMRIVVERRDFTGYVVVADDGPGVPPKDAERIFDKFQRGDQLPGLTGALGLGLGLSRHLAHLMGGDVTYRREADESLFELSLPLE